MKSAFYSSSLHRFSRMLLLVCGFLVLSGCRTDQALDVQDLFTLKTVTLPVLTTPRATRTHTPSMTPRASATATITPTETATPIPIHSPTPYFVDIASFGQAAEDKLEIIADITVPDGSVFKPGEMFVKSWRIKNSGNAIWNKQYRLAAAYSNPFESPQMTQAIFIQPTDLLDFAISTWNPRQHNVGQKATVDLVIPLQAPQQAGNYLVEFFLINAENEIVQPRFWVQFSVELLPEFATQTAAAMEQLTTTPTPSGETDRISVSAGTLTPQPYDWTGTWLIRDPNFTDELYPIQAWLTQTDNQLRGFFYDSNDEPVLIEGALTSAGRIFKGKFAQPWQNRATPVEWRMLLNHDQFYSVTQSGKLEFGSVCGGRNGMGFPDHCSMPTGD